MKTSSTDLNELRYEIYCKKLGSKDMKRKIQSNSLPPTSDTIAQHSLRVYHAVQAWIGVQKDPEMYGWQIVNGSYEPVTTLLTPAPDYLFIIHKCGCGSDCTTKRCLCKRKQTSCSLYCRYLR